MNDQEILMLLALGFILVVGGGSALYFKLLEYRESHKKHAH